MSAIQDVAELVETIRDATKLNWRWEPQHPQYIEGRFYLTPEQWAAIRTEWPLVPGKNQAQAIWGIPVDIIPPNEMILLPSGNVLVHSAVMEAFYIFDPAIADAAGLTPASIAGLAPPNHAASHETIDIYGSAE
jgi:hypothetical protein